MPEYDRDLALEILSQIIRSTQTIMKRFEPIQSAAGFIESEAGMEKLGTLVPGMLAGADLFGHAGIFGQDHGGCLTWLVIDNEAMGFAKRLYRGFEIGEDELAADVILEVGPAGNYLSHEHTVRHFRQELWFPNSLWMRESYEAWGTGGRSTMADRAITQVEDILANHQAEPLDPVLDKEIDRIVESAHRELVGE